MQHRWCHDQHASWTQRSHLHRWAVKPQPVVNKFIAHNRKTFIVPSLIVPPLLFFPYLIKTGLWLNIALLSALCLHSSTARLLLEILKHFHTDIDENDPQFLWGQNKRRDWWPQKPGKHENDPWLPQWDWKFKKGPRKRGRSSPRNASSFTKCYCINLRNLCNKISSVKRAVFPQKRSPLLWMTQGFTCNWRKASCGDQFCALHHQL